MFIFPISSGDPPSPRSGAQPDSLSYDESVELYRYHILLNPFNGEILEVWTEDFGWG